MAIGLACQRLQVSRIWHIEVLCVIMCHITRPLGVLIAAGMKLACSVNLVNMVDVVSVS